MPETEEQKTEAARRKALADKRKEQEDSLREDGHHADDSPNDPLIQPTTGG